MGRHRFDPVAMVVGVVFVTAAIIVLAGGRVIDEGRILLPVGLVAFGIALLAQAGGGRGDAGPAGRVPAAGPVPPEQTVGPVPAGPVTSGPPTTSPGPDPRPDPTEIRPTAEPPATDIETQVATPGAEVAPEPPTTGTGNDAHADVGPEPEGRPGADFYLGPGWQPTRPAPDDDQLPDDPPERAAP